MHWTTGTLSAYLEIYLQHMLGTHISVYGSVWTRGPNFIYPMMGTIMFNFAFELVILLLFFFVIAISFVKADFRTGRIQLPSRGLVYREFIKPA